MPPPGTTRRTAVACTAVNEYTWRFEGALNNDPPALMYWRVPIVAQPVLATPVSDVPTPGVDTVVYCSL